MQTLSAPTARHWDWQGHRIYFVHAPAQDREPSAQQRPPLLLIHGFGASTDHWRKNIEGLSDQFDVWAIDLLGFGRSSKPDISYSTDLWCEQLHDFINAQIGRPTVLAGNSLGGYSALCVAAQYPESVAGLVLLNSAGAFSDVTPPSVNPVQQTIATVMRSLILQPLPSWLVFQYARQRSVIRKTLQKVYLDQTAVTDRLVEEIYQPSCDPGAARVFAAVFKSPRGQTVDTLLQKMQCPLLLLWGEGDPWINTRSRGVKFRQHYTNLVEHYLQAGHCPHDEVPDQVNALIRSWIEEQVVSS